MPWIKSKFDMNNVLFLPDMATCHYSDIVIKFLNEQKLEFATKDENGPKFVQGRPIERYWALVKREYLKYSSKAKNLNSFIRRWKKCSEKVIESSGKNLFVNFRAKLK